MNVYLLSLVLLLVVSAAVLALLAGFISYDHKRTPEDAEEPPPERRAP
jgi:hypothetical protein